MSAVPVDDPFADLLARTRRVQAAEGRDIIGPDGDPPDPFEDLLDRTRAVGLKRTLDDAAAPPAGRAAAAIGLAERLSRQASTIATIEAPGLTGLPGGPERPIMSLRDTRELVEAPGPEVRPRNLGEETIEAVKRGAGRFSQGIGGAAEMVGKRLPGAVGRAVTQYGERTRGVSMEGTEAPTELPEETPGAYRFAYGAANVIGESAPQLAASVAAGVATGGLGLPAAVAAFTGTNVVPVVGQTYTDALAEHGDEGRATKEATLNGLITAASNQLPAVAILRKIPGGEQLIRGVANKFVPRILAAGSHEAVEEFVEQVGQEITADLIRQDRKADAAWVKELLTDPERWKQRAAAAGAGFFLGGAARGALERTGLAGAEEAPPPAEAKKKVAEIREQLKSGKVPREQQAALADEAIALERGIAEAEAPAEERPTELREPGYRERVGEQPARPELEAEHARRIEEEGRAAVGEEEGEDPFAGQRPGQPGLFTQPPEAPRRPGETRARERLAKMSPEERGRVRERAMLREEPAAADLVRAIDELEGGRFSERPGERIDVETQQGKYSAHAKRIQFRPGSYVHTTGLDVGSLEKLATEGLQAGGQAEASGFDTGTFAEHIGPEGKIRRYWGRDRVPVYIEMPEGVRGVLSKGGDFEVLSPGKSYVSAEDIGRARVRVGTDPNVYTLREVIDRAKQNARAAPAEAAGRAAEPTPMRQGRSAESAQRVEPAQPAEAVKPPRGDQGQRAAEPEARLEGEPRPAEVPKKAEEHRAEATKGETAEQLRENFTAKGPGHQRFAHQTAVMVKEDTLRDVDRDVLLEAFRDTDDEYLRGLTVKSNPRIRRVGLARAGLGVRIATVRTGLAKLGETMPSSRYAQAEIAPAVVALHEIAHIGHSVLLSPAERDTVARVWRSRSPQKWAAFFREGLSEEQPKGFSTYFAKNPAEFFVQSFAEYVLRNKIPDQRMSPLLERVTDLVRRAVARLRGRKDIAELEPLYEILLAGRHPPGTAAAAQTEATAGESLRKFRERLEQRAKPPATPPAETIPPIGETIPPIGETERAVPETKPPAAETKPAEVKPPKAPIRPTEPAVPDGKASDVLKAAIDRMHRIGGNVRGFFRDPEITFRPTAPKRFAQQQREEHERLQSLLTGGGWDVKFDDRGTWHITRRMVEAAKPAKPAQPEAPPPRRSLDDVGAKGRETTLVLPDGRELPAVYRIVDISDILPTHNPTKGFAPNPGGDVNERPYQDPTEGAESRARVGAMARNPNPALLLTDSPTATDGPPVVTPTGVVLGGNARAMAMQLAYSAGYRAQGEILRNAVHLAAARFGIDSEEVAKVKEPVLVRVLSAGYGAPGELSRVLNQPLTTGRSSITDAVSRGQRLGEDGAAAIASIVGEQTAREALADPRAQSRILQVFRESGAFTDAEISSLTRGGELTDQGKAAIESALLGAAVGDVRTMAETPASISRTLVRALPALVRLNRPEARGGDPGFRDSLRSALEGLGEIRREGIDLNRALQEATLTPQPWRSDDRAVALMYAFERASPTEMAKRLSDYAAAVDDVRSNQPRLDGSVPTIEEAWEYTIGRGFPAGGPDPDQYGLFGSSYTGGQRPLFGKPDEGPERPPPLESIAKPLAVNRETPLPGERPAYLADWTDQQIDDAADQYLEAAKKFEAKAKGKKGNAAASWLADAERARGDAARLRSYVKRAASRILAADDPQRPNESDAEYEARVKHRGAEEDTGSLFGPDAGEPLASRGMEPSLRRQYQIDELGFYLKAGRVLAEKIQGNKLQPRAFAKALERHGVTREEMKWTGLDDLILKAHNERRNLSRAEIETTLATMGATRLEEIAEGGQAQDSRYAQAVRQRDEATMLLRVALGNQGAASELLPRLTELATEGTAFDEITSLDLKARLPHATERDHTLIENAYEGIRAATATLRANPSSPATSGTRYSDLALPGGSRYREFVYKLPAGANPMLPSGQPFESPHWPDTNVLAHIRTTDRTDDRGRGVLFLEELQSDWHQQGRQSGYRDTFQLQRLWKERREMIAEHNATRIRASEFIDAHGNGPGARVGKAGWDSEANRLEWERLRARELELAAGVEEISDKANALEGGSPLAPLSEKWWQTFFRRAIRLAAEEGYDAIGWTTGAQQSERYEIGQYIETVEAEFRHDGSLAVFTTLAETGGEGPEFVARDEEELATLIGREPARKLWEDALADRAKEGNETGGRSSLDFADPLAVSGEQAAGLVDFYDRQLVDYARKYGKKWAAQYRRGEINTGRARDTAAGDTLDTVRWPKGERQPIHTLEITPAMIDSVMHEGQSLFGPDPLAEPTTRERLEGLGTDALDLGRAVLEGGKAIGQVLNRYGARAVTRVRQMGAEITEQGKARTEQAARARESAQEERRKAERAERLGNADEAAQHRALASRLDTAGRGAEATGKLKADAAGRVAEFAGKLTDFTRRAQSKENADTLAARKILGGLNARERRQLALLGQGRLRPLEVPAKVREANGAMLELMDNGAAGMNKAGALGLRRRMTDGQYIALGGAGEWYPQVLNRRGLDVARDLGRRGITSPKLEALASRMVEDGQFDDPDQARRALAEYLTSNLSGRNPYFEQVRVKLPAEYIDLDAPSVIERTIGRNARTVAAGETFDGFTETNDVAGVESVLGDLAYHLGEPTRRALEDFLRIELGHTPTTRANERRFVGALMVAQTATKLGNLFSPIRNLGQPWINSADYGLLPRLRAYFGQYPIGVAELTPWGRRAREEATRAGAVTGRSAMMDAPDVTARGAMQLVTDVLTFPQRFSERSNQVRAYFIGKNAALQDLARLTDLEGKNGRIRQLLRIVQDPSFGRLLPGEQAQRGSRGVLERRLQRLGFTREQLSEMVASGRPLSTEELQAAGYLMAHDTQFAMTTASKPLWWEQNPWLRLISQFKFFGIRQAGLMLDRGLKEAAMGNPLPLARFGVAALVFGELLAILKDYLTGSDRAASGLADPGQAPTAYRFAKRAARHLANGGFFGALADTDYGLTEYALGPTVGTARDVAGAGFQFGKRPTAAQGEMALRDLLDRQVPLVRQVRSVIDRVGKNRGRGAEYYRIRAELRELAGPDSGVEDALAEAERRTLGAAQYESGPGSLTYAFAARAITAGDRQAAADYLYDLLRSSSDRPKTIEGVKRSMSQRAPLGGASEADARRYLKGLPPDRAKAVAKLHRDWLADYAAAFRAAADRLRSEITPARPLTPATL